MTSYRVEKGQSKVRSEDQGLILLRPSLCHSEIG